ncbi:helix-turn-helix domain-containing protein [Caballeronia sp. INML3B]|uniref:helix-turn-helix domain-containing protein n=1 Tax=unclassified Caballeronia TaxID=2646786 RepID=UPI0039061E6B
MRLKEAISATRASKTIGLGKWQPTRPFLATFRTELLEAITTSNRKRSEQPTTHVLRRVEKLLSAVASRIEPSTLSELADETGIHSSTAYRLLSDMVTNRLLERTNRGTFKLGLYLLVLANLVKIRASMHGAALPAMSHLHARIAAIGHCVTRVDCQI